METIKKASQEDLIFPKKITYKEKYSEDIYEDFWEKREIIKDKLQKPSFLLNNFDEILEEIEKTQEILCIITDDIISNKIIDVLLNLHEKNIRIYLIIDNLRNDRENIREEKLKLLNKIVEKVLIRTLNNKNGHIILIDPHQEKLSKGFITNSPLIDLGKNYGNKFIKINLDKEQINDGFEIFKNLFWNLTQNEIINERNILNPLKVKDSPFKLKENTYKHFLINFDGHQELQESIIDLIERCKENLILCSENFNFSNEIKNLLSEKIQNIQGPNQIIIPRLIWPDPTFPNINHNTSIFGTDIVNFNFIIIDNNTYGIYILNGLRSDENSDENIYFGINLDEQQINEIYKLFIYIQQSIEYEYFYEKKLQDIKRNIEKFNINTNKYESQVIKNSDILSIGDIQTDNIDEFLNESKKPNFKKFKKRGLKNIEYKWNLLPPYLPINAKKSGLYSEWDETQKEFQKYIENFKLRLKKLSEQMDNNKSTYLKPLFLGKKLKIEELKAKIQKYEKLNLKNLSKLEEIKKIKDILSDLYNNLESHEKEIYSEIKRNEQIEKLTQKIDKLKEECQDYQVEIKRIENEIIEKSNTLTEKEQLLEEKRKKKKKKKENKDELKHLNSIIDKINQEINLLNKKKDKYNYKIKEKENEIKKCSEEINSFKKLSLDEKEKNSHSSGEIEGLREIMKLNPTKNKTKSKKSLSFSKNIKLDFNLKIPKEILPSTGILYENNRKNRFLAIKYYSEIKPGKNEAKRLNAKLVVNFNNQ
ncbi:MAG: hypothetical protein ACTSVK_09810 [Promethearchaeota archaeon]